MLKLGLKPAPPAPSQLYLYFIVYTYSIFYNSQIKDGSKTLCFLVGCKLWLKPDPLASPPSFLHSLICTNILPTPPLTAPLSKSSSSIFMCRICQGGNQLMVTLKFNLGLFCTIMLTHIVCNLDHDQLGK